jgi:hypothetical protein
MIDVVHKSVRVSAVPRTGRVLDATRGGIDRTVYFGQGTQSGDGGTDHPGSDEKKDEQLSSLESRVADLESRLNALQG